MKRLFWILMIAIVTSCGGKNEIPSHIMKENEMIDVLIELHIAQSQVQNLRLPSDSSKFLFQVLEKDLLARSNVKDSVFYQSYTWYLEHPEILHNVYTVVVDSLSLREGLARQTN